jgi:hypothetical protein
MGNAADTLVSKYPTRIAQLKKPVLDYLKSRGGELRYNGTEQDLYMAVFHPVSRRIPATQKFPSDVRKMNPGINTPLDYIKRVNASKTAAHLTDKEWTALKDTAASLGMSWEPLFKLINFESGWDPKARNPRSGARGLIQFMPRTAKGMGFKGTMGLGTTLVLMAGAWYIYKKVLKI